MAATTALACFTLFNMNVMINNVKNAGEAAVSTATASSSMLVKSETSPAVTSSNKWSETQIVAYMTENPQRAYFSRLFRDGGFRKGMEVGVAGGRYSEHFLKEMKQKSTPEHTYTWTMVEPFPNQALDKRYNYSDASGEWQEKGLLENIKHDFFKKLSLDQAGLIDRIDNESYDFIYLDGDHSYEGVKAEMPLFWAKVRPGGVLAGHDYCNHGEESLPCKGCENIPKCLPYTDYGVARGKSPNSIAKNQNGVVRAVQEWLMENSNLQLRLYHTDEDFTRESLGANGMDYDLLITSTRNPSWFIVKPVIGNVKNAGEAAVSTATASSSMLVKSETSPAVTSSNKWSETQIVAYMTENPQRAYFSRLFRDGGFRKGMEVGVAGGRYSEHFLKEMKQKSTPEHTYTWTMVEPFPNQALDKRYNYSDASGEWQEKGLLENIKHDFFKKLSLDQAGLIDRIDNESYDFIYLDGDHSYEGVKAEMPLFWAKVRPGGVLAGHDYCNHGEESLPCKGCENIPKCLPYTDYGVARGKSPNSIAKNQNGVVRAVQEWLMENSNLQLRLYHTDEDFTRESLGANGMDYDLLITSTRNPSWFIVKPVIGNLQPSPS